MSRGVIMTTECTADDARIRTLPLFRGVIYNTFRRRTSPVRSCARIQVSSVLSLFTPANARAFRAVNEIESTKVRDTSKCWICFFRFLNFAISYTFKQRSSDKTILRTKQFFCIIEILRVIILKKLFLES